MKKGAGSLLLILALLCVNTGLSASMPDAGSSIISAAMSFTLRTGLYTLSSERESAASRSPLSSLLLMSLPPITLRSRESEPDISRGSTDIPIGFEQSAWEEAEFFHDGEPSVLIYHTHTTEAYRVEENPKSYRSAEPAQGVVSVGSLTAKVLHDEFGVEVLYISEILDRPYDTAYDKSAEVITEAIAAYPSIKYIFDIHRDGLSDSPENRALYTTTLNGSSCAQIMTVLGRGSRYYEENSAFAKKVKSTMNELYPDMFRREITKTGHFNQQYSPYSLLFEVGSNLSTIADAQRAAVFLGRVLGTIITAER